MFQQNMILFIQQTKMMFWYLEFLKELIEIMCSRLYDLGSPTKYKILKTFRDFVGGCSSCCLSSHDFVTENKLSKTPESKIFKNLENILKLNIQSFCDTRKLLPIYIIFDMMTSSPKFLQIAEFQDKDYQCVKFYLHSLFRKRVRRKEKVNSPLQDQLSKHPTQDRVKNVYVMTFQMQVSSIVCIFALKIRAENKAFKFEITL